MTDRPLGPITTSQQLPLPALRPHLRAKRPNDQHELSTINRAVGFLIG